MFRFLRSRLLVSMNTRRRRKCSREIRALPDPVDEQFQNSPVDWSYLDAMERREINVSQFPRWAREFLDDIDDPEQRKLTEEMLLEQFSNKSLYDDAYFEEEDDDEDEEINDSHP